MNQQKKKTENHALEGLLASFRQQGVVLSVVSENALHIKGEVTAAQLEAVKKLKPQIINAVSNNQDFHLTENVFDSENETGTKVIQYLYDCGEKYKAENRILFVHNQPSVEAYEAEISLVDGIRQREAGNISTQALKTIVEHYILTHSPDADISPENWTGKDVPLVYFKILLNGEQLEAYTCNKIQSQILGAMWQRIHPEANFSVMPL